MTLKEVKNKLQSFELFQCGMYHEKIKLDSKTKIPLKSTIQNDCSYLRENLCNIKLREKRLGCAHSPVNNRFNDLINEINIDSNQVKKIQINFNKTILDIYELDHKKGNLEKELAEILLKNSPKIETKKRHLNKIDASINFHKKYINDLRFLKNELMNIIDIAIESKTESIAN